MCIIGRSKIQKITYRTRVQRNISALAWMKLKGNQVLEAVTRTILERSKIALIDLG